MTVEDDGRRYLESLPLKDYQSFYLARTIHLPKYRVFKKPTNLCTYSIVCVQKNRLLSARKQRTRAKHRERHYIPTVLFDS